MNTFDRVLIDPTPAERDAALQEAAATANARAQLRMVEWPPASYAAAVAEVEGTPEGWRQWNGGTGKGRSGESRSVVVLTWWTDFIGRKHHRVVGRRGNFNNAARKNLLASGDTRPPLWLTYCENLYLRQQEGAWEMFAVCPCGAAGAPREVGWMGPCCGPCHDRREGGEVIPRHPGDPADTVLRTDGDLLYACLSRDGGQLVSVRSYGGISALWDVATGASRAIPNAGWPTSARFSPDGKLFALGTARGDVELEAVGIVPGPSEAAEGVIRLETARQWPPVQMVSKMEFSPDGQTLAVLHRHLIERDYPGEAVLWDVRSQAWLPSPARQEYPVWAIALAPDGQTLALATGEQTITLWDVQAGQARRTFAARGSRLETLAYSPDGRLLAGGNLAGNVQLWDAATGRELADESGHVGRVAEVTFTPDGRFVISAGADATVRFWEAPAGRSRGVFKWHAGEIRSLSLAGPWLATGGADHAIKLWLWRSLLGV